MARAEDLVYLGEQIDGLLDRLEDMDRRLGELNSQLSDQSAALDRVGGTLRDLEHRLDQIKR